MLGQKVPEKIWRPFVNDGAHWFKFFSWEATLLVSQNNDSPHLLFQNWIELLRTLVPVRGK